MDCDYGGADDSFLTVGNGDGMEVLVAVAGTDNTDLVAIICGDDVGDGFAVSTRRFLEG